MKNILFICCVFAVSCSLESGSDELLQGEGSTERAINGEIPMDSVNNDETRDANTLLLNEVHDGFPPQKRVQYDFSSIEEQLSDSVKLALLRKIDFSKIPSSNDFEVAEAWDFKSYHVLDFNADALPDVIYDGKNPIGMESNNVIFFLNDGDSLRLVIKLNGDFTRIQLKNNQLQGFTMVKPPCCDYHVYHKKVYAFNAAEPCFVPYHADEKDYENSYTEINDPDFCVSLVRHFAHVRNTVFPSAVGPEHKAKVGKAVFLTPQPFEPTQTDFEVDPGIFAFLEDTENKAIAQLSAGLECKVLSEKMLDSGETYCFILFTNKAQKNNYMHDIDAEQFGWVNKHSLQFI